ncbi:MAG: condensation domain-containing protein, partial [Verrucomicrobiales bacterium]
MKDSDMRGDWKRYWLECFAEPVPPLRLPVDQAGLEESNPCAGPVVERLDQETTHSLNRLAGSSGVSMFGLLMSAYLVLLHRISRQNRLIVAFPSAGRCVTFLPLVADIDSEQPFVDFVQRVQEGLLGAVEHQDADFGQAVVEAVFSFEPIDATKGF